jgi:hypothetical protein
MRESRRAAFAALWIALGAACGGGPRDLLVERCGEVVQYRDASLRDIEILKVERGPGVSAVTLAYQARAEPSREQVRSRIACEFEPTDRWSLVAVRIDGHELTEAELALVNSELLLRDLSRSPERLGGGS